MRLIEAMHGTAVRRATRACAVLLIATASSMAQAAPPKTVTPADISALVNQQHGNVVVVNFWATWCPPCLREFPDLISFYRNYRAKGVDVVGVSMNADDELPDIDAFAAKFSPPFTLYRAASADDAFQKGVLAIWFGEMPMTLVFDKNGKLARTYKKPLTYTELAADVDALLR